MNFEEQAEKKVKTDFTMMNIQTPIIFSQMAAA